MKRTSAKERARDRILNDDEIRAVWKAADGTFGDMVKLLLLTGQRREKVAAMRWQDISIDGEWNVPEGDREKGVGGSLVLPALAADIIRARPRYASSPYVFTGRGGSHLSGYSKAKTQLDERAKIAEWRLHDLRRTARSLMSRVGVRPDIAERVLGHVQPGVQGVYDRQGLAKKRPTH